MTDQKQMNTVDSMLPIPQLFAFGLQHVLAMYAGAVAVPIIVAQAMNLPMEDLIRLITADLFTCRGFDSPYYSRLVYLWHCDLNPNIRLW